MKTDSISSIQINSFTARTPKSKVTLNGRADNLLSDAKCNLNFGFDLFLSEFKPMIPKDINANVSGNTDGTLMHVFHFHKLRSNSSIVYVQMGKPICTILMPYMTQLKLA